MPSSRPKPSEVAVEAKREFIPYIKHHFAKEWPTHSYLCYSESLPRSQPDRSRHCRFAFYERDPVDVALDWYEADGNSIPVIMPANEKRPGGDWEAGVMSPEECLCRRSTLYGALTTPGPESGESSHYPIPAKAGIFSEKVVVFRSGPEKYSIWPMKDYKALPIISVVPVRRPKLDTSGKKYSFDDERELMREKIKTALRIAVFYRYPQIVIGSFGLGPGFRNPPLEVANMWKHALIDDPEFAGHFSDAVFAFDPQDTGASSSSSSSKSKSKSGSSSKSSSSSSSSSAKSDLAVFEYVFKPANIHGAYR
ncbi:hypothetical protein BP5796_07103 [Coleophoma crateriformis]|uniref:Microbial-type PARG catalytic domain-containing protein n=1 Tax=Coleophoma crateriformis TaxID=565419 RepID=A0A3D8RII8_9HELO|nr:hypothetical protein BP5796_07103 [Coleophoma crateriformis]